MYKRSSDNIIKERQDKYTKTEKLINKNIKHVKKLRCSTNAFKLISEEDLIPFLKDENLQIAFMNARLHWLISDVKNNRILSDIITRQKIRIYESENHFMWPNLIIDDITRNEFIIHRRRNFIAYIKSKECKFFRDEISTIATKKLIDKRETENKIRNCIMHFIHLHEIHKLILYNWLGQPVGIPKIYSKSGFQIHSNQYELSNKMDVPGNYKVFKFKKQKNQPNGMASIIITENPEFAIKCYQELELLFGQYHLFFSLIFAFSQ